jgi:hypothetical protein
MVEPNTAPNTEVESGTEPEVAEGTTSRIFGESEADGQPNATVEGKETTTPAPTTEPTDKATDTPVEQGSGGQKFKVKVDGEEKEISYDELVKGYQLNETIAQRGQKLGAERQANATERTELEALRAEVKAMTQGVTGGVQQTQPQQIPGIDYDMLDEATRQALDAVQATHSQEMAQVNQTLQRISAGIQPMQVEQEYRRIANDLKTANPAHNDFLDKVGEIENAILTLPPERQAEYGTPLGYMNIYKDIKAKEFQAQTPGEAPTPSLVPRTESGTGVPSGVDGEASKRVKLFANAKEASSLKDIRDGRQVDPNAEWAKYFDSVS